MEILNAYIGGIITGLLLSVIIGFWVFIAERHSKYKNTSLTDKHQDQ